MGITSNVNETSKQKKDEYCISTCKTVSCTTFWYLTCKPSSWTFLQLACVKWNTHFHGDVSPSQNLSVMQPLYTHQRKQWFQNWLVITGFTIRHWYVHYRNLFLALLLHTGVDNRWIKGWSKSLNVPSTNQVLHVLKSCRWFIDVFHISNKDVFFMIWPKFETNQGH